MKTFEIESMAKEVMEEGVDSGSGGSDGECDEIDGGIREINSEKGKSGAEVKD